MQEIHNCAGYCIYLAFGSGDNLHAIWDILYIYSLGV